MMYLLNLFLKCIDLYTKIAMDSCSTRIAGDCIAKYGFLEQNKCNWTELKGRGSDSPA
jgi:hypothetical protein